ncbi:MAG TPA: type 1 glutamine amidotransferase [Methanoregulaceae archaeon]|nr:type 1 glutamine amidotransferase [Methanoregulaceae archaeon]HNB03033.1 type 1 glutamine amidotransferase [Methanoregulaceae archaeon]HNJ80125.1 type 1 glutamine amidotransferase [Methanoregulaceae archaeon]HNO08911.1 type 1 glutamine amidotransferase [Methanoregulaceae archaeon]
MIIDKPSVAILQHERNEPGGLFTEHIRERGMELIQVPLYETNEVPPLHATHLIIMGGSMSVNDEQEFPWLISEKQIIREWVAKGRPVLGICLGAQLIASSFGAPVYPCKKELGWSSVNAIEDELFPELPGRFNVFQMHGETFDIPEPGMLVFCGEEVLNQAICIGSALGLQFHPELTLEMIQDWISFLPSQTQESLLAQSRQYLPESEKICRTIADRFLNASSHAFSWMRSAG